MNTFIEKARNNNKNVLIHSYKGINRAAVFAVQYLIAKKRCGHEVALNYLRSYSGCVLHESFK